MVYLCDLRSVESRHELGLGRDFFDRLEIRRGDTVFLHTAFGRLRHHFRSPLELIERLIGCLGDEGTLVMPRYAWNLLPETRPWRGYAEYLRARPVMDLRFTPANIGAVPEAFRAIKGMESSVSYFWPVTARGALASHLVAGQGAIVHAYESESVFGRLVAWDAKKFLAWL